MKMKTPILSTTMFTSNIVNELHIREEDAKRATECVVGEVYSAVRRIGKGKEINQIRGFGNVPGLDPEEILNTVVSSVGLPMDKAEKVVGIIENTIWNELKENDQVEVLPLGTFIIDRNSSTKVIMWGDKAQSRHEVRFEPIRPPKINLP